MRIAGTKGIRDGCLRTSVGCDVDRRTEANRLPAGGAHSGVRLRPLLLICRNDRRQPQYEKALSK
jgi:hypothetical protein